MKSQLLIAAVLALGFPGAVVAGKEAVHLVQKAATHKGEGTVLKVDAAAGKFNMSHGPIPSLNWPAMTMDFQVKDKAILKDIKPGQKVEITIVQESRIDFYVTQIKPLP
ncbi:MAG TPA: copper-binding protein [Burkholderiales bacterium]|nr:copper-binding protein [Burkholderiales bacterium]